MRVAIDGVDAVLDASNERRAARAVLVDGMLRLVAAADGPTFAQWLAAR